MNKQKKLSKILIIFMFALIILPFKANIIEAFDFPTALGLIESDYFLDQKTGSLIRKSDGSVLSRYDATVLFTPSNNFSPHDDVIGIVGSTIGIPRIEIYVHSSGVYIDPITNKQINLLTGHFKDDGFNHAGNFDDNNYLTINNSNNYAVHRRSGILIDKDGNIISTPIEEPHIFPTGSLVIGHGVTEITIYDALTREYRNSSGHLFDGSGGFIGESSSSSEDDYIQEINTISVQQPASVTPIDNINMPNASLNEKTKIENQTEEKVADVSMSTPITQIYNDIPQNAWYKCSVKYVVKNGLMMGNANSFMPNDKISKSMLVSVLHRLSKSPKSNISTNISDVSDNSWDSDAIYWSVDNNISTLNTDNTFKGSDAISREDLILILYKYTKYRDIDVSQKANLDKYSDKNKISIANLDAMSWAVQKGIITGDNDKIYPKGFTTRAEFAAILKRYGNNILK